MTGNIKTVTVGLLWHSLSSDNLGVGALTESQIAICEAAAKQAGVALKYVVFGTQGGSSYFPEGIDVSFGGKVSIKALFKNSRENFLTELRKCDLVLDIGEGDSFTDIYGIKRFLFLLLTKYAVIQKGIPLILSPQTIGPFNNPICKFLARAIMLRAERVFARDGLSFDYLRSEGVDNIDEVIDVAFRLPYKTSESSESGSRNYGLNVSGLLYSGGYTGKNQFGLSIDYKRLVKHSIAKWVNEPGATVWLIPHVLSDDLPSDDDRLAIDELIKEFPAARRAPDFKSPSEAKSFISGMDFVTGARMHACIAAFSSGVPVVPIAYSRKFNGLFSSLNYTWFVDGKKSSTDDAIALLDKAVLSIADLETSVAKGNALAQNKLATYEGYLVKLFSKFKGD